MHIKLSTKEPAAALNRALTQAGKMWVPSSFLVTCTTIDLQKDEHKGLLSETVNTNWTCSTLYFIFS